MGGLRFAGGDCGFADSCGNGICEERPCESCVFDEERHVRFHDLRHTCASHLVQGSWLAQPMDLYRVKQWMGHSSIQVTQRYAHLAPGGIHDLAATWAGEEANERT